MDESNLDSKNLPPENPLDASDPDQSDTDQPDNDPDELPEENDLPDVADIQNATPESVLDAETDAAKPDETVSLEPVDSESDTDPNELPDENELPEIADQPDTPPILDAGSSSDDEPQAAAQQTEDNNPVDLPPPVFASSDDNSQPVDTEVPTGDSGGNEPSADEGLPPAEQPQDWGGAADASMPTMDASEPDNDAIMRHMEMMSEMQNMAIRLTMMQSSIDAVGEYPFGR